jgi:hypothetical protein
MNKKRLVLTAVVVVLIILVIAVALAQLLIENGNTTSNPSSSSPLPSTPTPKITSTSYVEVNCQIVGWFYGTGNLPDANYNYTYLVLNVTITNHGYSQVNTIGSYGFSVVVHGNTFQALYSTPLLSILNASNINEVNNVYQQNYDFDSHFYYSFYPSLFDPNLPNPATLLDTGSINGLVVFQFGSSTIYPQPAQILNEPFTLQYSVTYGNEATLSGPNATAAINQK